MTLKHLYDAASLMTLTTRLGNSIATVARRNKLHNYVNAQRLQDVNNAKKCTEEGPIM